jgi:CDP-diacylglycerol--glycerol-3-phosphate 3-phosphatidyltransferase
VTDTAPAAHDAASSTYGPSAIATPANAVTVIRVIVAPFMFSLIVNEGASWKVFGAWTVMACTDGIDGYIARRMGTTRSGAFLDPLADKVLVLGGMCSLASTGVFPWFPVVLMGGRELLISLYRVYWGRQGLAVPARTSAKAKTLAQSVAVGFALMPWLQDTPEVALVMLWVSVGLALLSAAQYLLDGTRALTKMEHPSAL